MGWGRPCGHTGKWAARGRRSWAASSFSVTIGAGQTLEVPLLLEGTAVNVDPNLVATFHAINLADGILANGLAAVGVPDATDSLTLHLRAVDLSVGSMPEVYEDTLASVVPCNKDYDDGYVDTNQNPLPDNTDPLPGGATPPPAHAGEDDLVSATLTFPYGFHGTWTLTIPTGLRVWQWTGSAWAEVTSGTAYARSGGGGISLRVEGLSATAATEYLTVSAQFTDTSDDPIGLPLVDQVKVEVVSIDLQIQDISEHDEDTTPALVMVDDDYDAGKVHPISGEAMTDNNRLHDEIVSVSPWPGAGDDDLVPGTLTIAGPSGQHGKWWIEVTGEPSTVNGDGTGPGEYPGYDQYIRVWLPDGTPVPRDAANALPITLDAAAVDLLIEGLALPSEAGAIRLTAHFEPDGDYPFAGSLQDILDSVLANLLKVEIERTDGGDVDITGKTTQVIVGQHVGLKVVGILPGGQNLLFSTVKWAIPGRVNGTNTDWAIANYTQTINAGVVTPISAADLASEQVGYYWINGATNGGMKLVVAVDADGYHRTATFDVLRPTATLTYAPLGKVNVGYSGIPKLGKNSLHFGTVASYGITWSTATVTAPSGGKGQIQLVQTVAPTISRRDVNSDWWDYRAQNPGSGYNPGDPVLDGRRVAFRGRVVDINDVDVGKPKRLTLADGKPLWDAPGVSLNNPLTDYMCATMRFWDYLMYRPAGDDSIFVTLLSMSWYWAGDAQLTSNKWVLVPGANRGAVPSNDTVVLPEWKDNFGDFNWVRV